VTGSPWLAGPCPMRIFATGLLKTFPPERPEHGSKFK
jgi:hypothetical protein